MEQLGETGLLQGKGGVMLLYIKRVSHKDTYLVIDDTDTLLLHVRSYVGYDFCKCK